MRDAKMKLCKVRFNKNFVKRWVDDDDNWHRVKGGVEHTLPADTRIRRIQNVV